MSEDGKAGVEIREANKKGLSIIDKPLEKNHNTRDTIAKDLGWSTGKTAYGRKRGFYLLPYLLH